MADDVFPTKMTFNKFSGFRKGDSIWQMFPFYTTPLGSVVSDGKNRFNITVIYNFSIVIHDTAATQGTYPAFRPAPHHFTIKGYNVIRCTRWQYWLRFACTLCSAIWGLPNWLNHGVALSRLGVYLLMGEFLLLFEHEKTKYFRTNRLINLICEREK